MHTPPIDPRDRDQLAAQTSALAQRYTTDTGVEPGRGWRPREDGGADAGQALIAIFARFAEIVVDRINRAPERNYLAFLNLIGIEPLPPRPARVPLTFTLAEGSPGCRGGAGRHAGRSAGARRRGRRPGLRDRGRAGGEPGAAAGGRRRRRGDRHLQRPDRRGARPARRAVRGVRRRPAGAAPAVPRLRPAVDRAGHEERDDHDRVAGHRAVDELAVHLVAVGRRRPGSRCPAPARFATARGGSPSPPCRS